MKKFIGISFALLLFIPALLFGMLEVGFQETTDDGKSSFKEYLNQFSFESKELPDIANITACAIENEDFRMCFESEIQADEELRVMLEEAMHVESFEGMLPEELFEHTYHYPLKPSTYHKTSGFGFRFDPISEEISFHDAVDLASDFGVDVYSMYEGKVVEQGYDEVKGNYINILHRIYDEEQTNCRIEKYHDGQGKLIYEEYMCDSVLLYEYFIETQYLHLENILVGSGQTVRAGSKIGTVGSTGYSTGAHLHFAVLYQNKFLNPYAFIDF